MARLLLGCLLLIGSSQAILLPNHKNSAQAAVLPDHAISSGVADEDRKSPETMDLHSKPMILPAIQTFDISTGGVDQAAVGPSVRPSPMIMPAILPQSGDENSAKKKLGLLFTPDIFPMSGGGVPVQKEIADSKLEQYIAMGKDKSVRLPSYHVSPPQISPSESIVNPFIPPVAVKKNQPGQKPVTYDKPPVMAPPKKKDSGPQFNTNLLAGSPVMEILSNLSSDCQQSFSALAKSVNTLTIADFKQKFYNWSVECDKEDIVEELENKTETAREAVRANMTLLIQELPLYLMPLQTLEKNESLTVAEKLQAVKDYMASIPDPNIAKTITFLNQLFVGEMIPQFLPSLGKQTKKSDRLKSALPKKKSKRSVDSSSEEAIHFEFGEAVPHL